MSASPADLYDAARRRLTELVRCLGPDELVTAVPACPGWSVQDVVAHLVGLAADATAGRPPEDGGPIPGPQTTARQVGERAGRAVGDVLDEWAELAPGVRDGLDQRRFPVALAVDVLTHEGDVREALGRPAPPAEDGWGRALGWVARSLPSEPGVLEVRAGEQVFRSGDGEPAASATTSPYELWRALMSRRSRAQVRAWEWTGDAEPFVDRIGAFGPRDDDQPVPPVATG